MFETHDAVGNQPVNTTDSTSSILSGCAFDSMKQLAGCARPSFENKGPSENPISEIGPKVAKGVAETIEAGPTDSSSFDDQIKMLNSFIKANSPEDRKLAENLNSAFISGNINSFADVLQSASGDPMELRKAVMALDARLNLLEGSKPDNALDMKMLNGFVFVWPERGGLSKALQIDTRDGEVKAFPSVVTREGTPHINVEQELNLDSASLFSSMVRDELGTLRYPTRR